MAATPTNVQFLAALNAMSITGVVKSYSQPPLSLSTGDLPAGFPMVLSSGQGELLSTCIELSKTRSAGYAICIEPIGQGTQVLNYARLAPLLDAFETALDGLTIANFIEYNLITTTEFQVAGNNYWTIVAEINARSA